MSVLVPNSPSHRCVVYYVLRKLFTSKLKGRLPRPWYGISKNVALVGHQKWPMPNFDRNSNPNSYHSVDGILLLCYFFIYDKVFGFSSWTRNDHSQLSQPDFGWAHSNTTTSSLRSMPSHKRHDIARFSFSWYELLAGVSQRCGSRA